MDIVATLTEGVILGLPWVVLGLATFVLARNRAKRWLFTQIIDESLSFFDDVAKHPEAYEDLTAPISAGAVNIVGMAMSRLAADVQKNPDKYAAILKPVLMKAVKEGLSGQGGMMPKVKWQDALGFGLMQIVNRFAGGLETQGAKKVIEMAVEDNPFK